MLAGHHALLRALALATAFLLGGGAMATRFPGAPRPPDRESASDSLGPYGVTFQEIVPDVVVATRPGYARLPVQGNVTLIFNDNDVVAVDAGAAPIAARRIIRYVRSRADRPVSTLVISHGHEDHVLGIQEWVAAYPGIHVLTQRGTRPYIAEAVAGRVAGFADGVEERREAGLARLEGIRGTPSLGGGPMAAHLERYYRHDLDIQRSEYSTVTVTPPDVTFEKEVVLHRPGRTIRVLHRPGKTASDAVVLLPEDGVLVLGDILTHPIPYGFAAAPTVWLDALRWVAQTDARYLIPGHGDVLVDRTHLDAVIELVEYVNRTVAKAVADGVDLDHVPERIDVERWRMRLVGSDAVLRRYFDLWYLDPALERRFRELTAGAS